MKISDLRKAAEKERRKAKRALHAIGLCQGKRDISLDWNSLAESSIVTWARNGPRLQDSQVQDWADEIIKMADAIDLYLYAKKHGLGRAALWKLSNE